MDYEYDAYFPPADSYGGTEDFGGPTTSQPGYDVTNDYQPTNYTFDDEPWYDNSHSSNAGGDSNAAGNMDWMDGIWEAVVNSDVTEGVLDALYQSWLQDQRFKQQKSLQPSGPTLAEVSMARLNWEKQKHKAHTKSINNPDIRTAPVTLR